MKKIFNLSVILSVLMAAFTFASCGDDASDIEDDFGNADTSDKYTKRSEISVVKGGEYAVSNSSIEGGILKFKVTSVSGEAGKKVVTFKVELKGDDANGKSFEIGDDSEHASYFGRKDGVLCAMKQKEAVANASNVIMALSSEAKDYLITSATVNNPVKEAGATVSEFLIYEKSVK